MERVLRRCMLAGLLLCGASAQAEKPAIPISGSDGFIIVLLMIFFVSVQAAPFLLLFVAAFKKELNVNWRVLGIAIALIGALASLWFLVMWIYRSATPDDLVMSPLYAIGAGATTLFFCGLGLLAFRRLRISQREQSARVVASNEDQ